MENLLALDINENSVCGVLLELGQKTSVVRSYCVASTEELTLSEAVADVVHRTGFRQGECRVSLPAGKCSFRNLSLPFRDKRKVAKVLPFELEELTSFAMEGFQFDYLAIGGDGDVTDIVAGLVEKSYLVEMLAALASAGIDPECVTVGGLPTAIALMTMSSSHSTFVLIDIGFQKATMVLIGEGKIRLVRSLGINSEAMGGFSLSLAEGKVLCTKPEMSSEIVRSIMQQLRQTLLSIGRASFFEDGGLCFVNGAIGLYPAVFEQLRRSLSGEVTACNVSKRLLLKVEHQEEQEWSPALLNSGLALAVWKKNEGQILNFRTGDFRKRRSFKEVRKNVVALALVGLVTCCGLLGYLGWEYSQLSRQRDALNDDILTIFRKTLPEVNRVVDPVQQLQVKVDEVRKGYGGGQGNGSVRKLALLAELSARIPEDLPIRITRLVSDRDDLRIMAETRDFNAVDNVKRELEKSTMFSSVVISSANLAPKGGDVRFELRLIFR